MPELPLTVPHSSLVLANTHGERCYTTSECKSADASLECRRVTNPKNAPAATKKCSCVKAWLLDGYKIFRLYAFGPSGLKDYGSTMLCCKC